MDEIFDNNLSLSEWNNFYKKHFLDLILSEEYGFRDETINNAVFSYKIVQEKKQNNICMCKVIMTYMDLDMRFYIYRKDDNETHPGFIYMLHEYAEDNSGPDLLENYQNIPTCPIDEIIKRGYFVVIMPTREIAQDKFTSIGDSYRGIFEIINKDIRPDDWGTLQAWSLGLSKVMDYISKQSFADENNIAVIGHSRGGKTALITGAQDERFKLTISSCSGQSGAALSRNRINGGETITMINKYFGYWFDDNFKKYNDNPDKLPFDQHHLLAQIAPRYLYVFSAKEDLHADPDSELLSCKYASSYFELYGINGLVVPNELEINKSYNEGHIAYHIKDGRHCLEPRDWRMVMDYFDKII